MRFLVAAAVLAWLAALCVLASPYDSDGIQVLAVLSEPYGANTYLLANAFRLQGWEVTYAAVEPTVTACHARCPTIEVDTTLASVDRITSYDVLAIMPTPGTYRTVLDPAGDLRSDWRILTLVRQAENSGLTLFAGCTGLLVLGDASLLEGRTVNCHARLMDACEEYGATCNAASSRKLPPSIDEGIVTATNQRAIAAEISEAIQRSLDRWDDFAPAHESLRAHDAAVSATSVSLPTSGDLAPEEQAAFALGGPLADGARAVSPFEDGFVLVGYTFSFGEGRSDMLIACLDAEGTPRWARTFGGPGCEYANDVCIARDGGILVVGSTTSAGAGTEDVLLVKLDSQGQLLWAKTFGGPSADAGFGLCETANGDLVLCGVTESFGDGRSDLYVVRTSSDGGALWSSPYGQTGYDRGTRVTESNDGGLLIVGGAAQGAGNYNMMLTKLSETGEKLWTRSFGGASYNVASGVAETEEGRIVVVGSGDVEGTDLMDVELSGCNAAGLVEWTTKTGPSRSYDYGQSLMVESDGQIIVCGVTNYPATGMNDVWILRFSGEGDLLSDQRIGGDGTDWASDLCRLGSQVIVVGFTDSAGAGSYDALILALDIE